jgi:hypothetical protein
MDKLPLPFLIGYPFFVEKGAVFDLNVPTVVLNKTPSRPVINLLPTTSESIPSIDSFSIFTGNYEPLTINAIFCNVKQDLDISDAEAETQLQALLQESNSVFDLSDKTPAIWLKLI